MALKTRLGMFLLGTFLFAFGTVLAQEPEGEDAAAVAEKTIDESAPAPDAADDYVAVWLVIEEQWEAVQRGEKEWIEELLSADFIGWPENSPHPRDRASTRRWNEFARKQSKGLEHEIYPLETVIHGDMAVAHYLYSNATEDREGKTEVSNGRYTDILVRVDGQWKFIAWHGGDDDSGD